MQQKLLPVRKWFVYCSDCKKLFEHYSKYKVTRKKYCPRCVARRKHAGLPAYVKKMILEGKIEVLTKTLNYSSHGIYDDIDDFITKLQKQLKEL